MASTSQLQAARERARRAIARRNEASGTWSVSRPGPGSTNPTTGDWSPTFTTIATALPAHMHAETRGRPTVTDRDDTALLIEAPTLCVAGDAVALAIGDVVEPVEVTDPTLAGRSFTVTGIPVSGHGVKRHYPLIETTGGGS